MFDIEKFHGLATVDGFNLNNVPLAIRESIVYTYNDTSRLADMRYLQGDQWVAGFKIPCVFTSVAQSNSPALSPRPAFCMTVGCSTGWKLGIMIEGGATVYNRYHDMLEIPGMREAVANAFGYSDAVLISGSVGNARAYVDDNTNYREVGVVPAYSDLYASDVLWSAVDQGSVPAVKDCLPGPFTGDNRQARAPYCHKWLADGTLITVIPVEHYITDIQNVATINTTCDALLQDRVTTNASAIANEAERAAHVEDAIMDAVDKLPVFGLSLIDAAAAAATMRNAQQYIPRP